MRKGKECEMRRTRRRGERGKETRVLQGDAILVRARGFWSGTKGRELVQDQV